MGQLTAGPSAESTRALRREARRWSWHVLEGVAAFAIVILVLELNLQLHLELVPSRLFSFLASTVGAGDGILAPVREVLARQADVAFYAFLGPLAIWSLRLLQKRPALHRQGTRELLIGDVPYVHQIVWLLARRLFGLSYGFASLKPYSANCQDELIMTHEPLRGTLVLIGLPDSRRQNLRERSAAAFMTAKQFNNSRSFAGAGAEIVTIGHAPPASGSDLGAHIALPSAAPQLSTERVDLLTEQLFDSWERLMGMQVFLDRVAREVSHFAPVAYDRSRTKDQVFAPTTAAPVSAASIYQLLSRSAERYERFQDLSLPFEVVRSDWRGSAPRLKTTVLKS